MRRGKFFVCEFEKQNSQWYSTRYIQKRWVPVGERNRALSHYKDILLSMWISIIKIKWSWDHLIFIIGILTLVRQLLYIEILSWQQQCRKTQRFVTIKWLYITVTSQEHLRCLKPQTTPQFDQQQVQVNNTENIKSLHYWQLLWGIHQSPLDPWTDRSSSKISLLHRKPKIINS